MLAENYSRRIEALLRKVKGDSYRKSDEILLDPYKEIFLALEYRVPQEKLEKFELWYQAIEGQSLQELLDDNYDMEKLLQDIRQLVEND